MSRNKLEEIKQRIANGPASEVHTELLGKKDNVSDNLNGGNTPSNNPNVNVSGEDKGSVAMNIEVPIAQPKKGIKETHTTKAFYIRNDLAELVNETIRNSRRGAMTEIINALIEQYYRNIGRYK